MDTSKIRPRCYIIYQEEEMQSSYGVGALIESPVPDNYYQHEVRPRKRNPYRIHFRTRIHGLAWSFVRMELLSHRMKMPPPWRWSKYGDDQPKHDRRPIMVMLEPDQLDLRFFSDHERLWKRFDRVPKLHLGAGSLGRLPPTFMRWLDGVLALTPAGHKYAYEALEGLDTRADFIPTDRLLTPGEPKFTYGIAQNWDSGGKRNRSPSMAPFILSKLPPGTVAPLQDEAHGASVIESANCRAYLVLSQAEEMVPYDAILALAGGATVIGPDIPIWRGIKSIKPKKVALYPVRPQGNNRCVWNALDVAAFLKSRLKKK